MALVHSILSTKMLLSQNSIFEPKKIPGLLKKKVYILNFEHIVFELEFV